MDYMLYYFPRFGVDGDFRSHVRSEVRVASAYLVRTFIVSVSNELKLKSVMVRVTCHRSHTS